MPYVQTPMTDRIRAAVGAGWGLALRGQAVRLRGGEESASHRFGGHVVRIGPTWRSDAELAWCYALASAVSGEVPEVAAPVALPCRGHVLRVDGRPVSVWRYVEGSWADRDDDGQRTRAAELLARLHRALAKLPDLPPRPGQGDLAWWGEPHPDVADPDLDRWSETFLSRRRTRQALHGDFYPGNVLVRRGRIVGLLDSDDALSGPPEQELAWAAAEWGDVRRTLDLATAARFVDAYLDAGGPADRIGDEELAQLIRGRLRMEVTYSHATGQWGAGDDPGSGRTRLASSAPSCRCACRPRGRPEPRSRVSGEPFGRAELSPVDIYLARRGAGQVVWSASGRARSMLVTIELNTGS